MVYSLNTFNCIKKNAFDVQKNNIRHVVWFPLENLTDISYILATLSNSQEKNRCLNPVKITKDLHAHRIQMGSQNMFNSLNLVSDTVSILLLTVKRPREHQRHIRQARPE